MTTCTYIGGRSHTYTQRIPLYSIVLSLSLSNSLSVLHPSYAKLHIIATMYRVCPSQYVVHEIRVFKPFDYCSYFLNENFTSAAGVERS